MMHVAPPDLADPSPAGGATDHARPPSAAGAPATGVARRRRRAASHAALLAGAVALGALLRFHLIGAKSMWLDEVYSVVFARYPWDGFVHTMVVREANMALYYLLLRPWLALGDGEAAVRSLSAVFSVATIPVLYRVGARLYGRGAGVTAAALLAVHAFHVKYAQEARGYALHVLIATVAALLLVRAVERPTWRAWLAYAVAGALVVYSHFFGALILGAQWLSLLPLLLRRRRVLAWGPVAAGALLTVVLLAPLAYFLLSGRLSGASYWMQFPSAEQLAYFRHTMVGAGDWTAGRLFLAGVYALALAAAVVAAVREGRRAEGRAAEAADAPPGAASRLAGWRHWMPLSWGLVPTALTLGVSLVRPIFQDRYLIASSPALVLLVAVALHGLRPPRLRAWAMGLVGGASLLGVVDYYRREDKENWRGATAYVTARARPGDAVVLYEPYVSACYDYYRSRATREREGRGAAATGPDVVFPHPNERSREVLDATLATLPGRYGRVWVVSSHADDRGRFIEDSLERHYPAVLERQFHQVRVLLFEPAHVRVATPPR